MVKGLKKYAAILGLTLSCTLVTACNYNESESIVITEGQELTGRELKYINKKLDKIKIDYDYEDRYMSKDCLKDFINDSYEDIYCETVIPSDDIDKLVKDVVCKIEENSKFVIENSVLDIDDYNIEDYDASGFILEESASFREFLYNSIYSMFLNNDKEDWNNLYCNLSDTAILFCDTLINNGISIKVRIGSSLDSDRRYFNLVYLNLKRIKLISGIACQNTNDYNEFFPGFVKSNLLHELEHCHQEHCNCWYKKNSSVFENNIFLGNLHSKFISESSADFFSEKYYQFMDKFHNHNCISYDEEIETSYMVETSLLLRKDYEKDDIFDNSVSVSSKKISDWFETDKRRDYRDLMNMMFVFSITNSTSQETYEKLINETYNDNNVEKLDAKKILLREDAILELTLYSYKNLIKFAENNDISKDAFYFLFDTYQRYYLNKAKLYDSEVFGYYFADEFREKFNLATDIVYDYASIKYGNKEKIQKEALEKLEIILDDEDYYGVTKVVNAKKSDKEYSYFDNEYPYMNELLPILGDDKYFAILDMAKEVANMPLLEYFNATDYSLDSYIESLENNNVMKKSISFNLRRRYR